MGFCHFDGRKVCRLVWSWRLGSNDISDEEISHNVYKSLALNSLSLLSIYFLDLLDPVVKTYPKLGWFYRILWLLPIIGISLYLNVRPITVHARN